MAMELLKRPASPGLGSSTESTASYSTASVSSDPPSSLDGFSLSQTAVSTKDELHQGTLHASSRYNLRETPERLKRAAEAAVTSHDEFDLLDQQIGEGGFGTVLRARHKRTGDLVAAKIVTAGAREHVSLRLPPGRDS